VDLTEGKEKKTATNVTAPGGGPIGSQRPPHPHPHPHGHAHDGYESGPPIVGNGPIGSLNYSQSLGPSVSVPVSVPTAGGGTTLSYVQVPLSALSGLTAQQPAPSPYPDPRMGGGGGGLGGGVSSGSSVSTYGSTGVVKWFDTKKGYGFIVPNNGGKEVFVHESCLKPGTRLMQGQMVDYQTELKGDSLKAISVSVQSGSVSSGGKSPPPLHSSGSQSVSTHTRKRKGSSDSIYDNLSRSYETTKAHRSSYENPHPYPVLALNLGGYEQHVNPSVYPMPSSFAHAQQHSYRYDSQPSHRY